MTPNRKDRRMPCPTCSHTMQRVELRTLWCPRCGTIGTRDDDTLSEAPMLVKRCRDFQTAVVGKLNVAGISDPWKIIGIAESINTPENRP